MSRSGGTCIQVWKYSKSIYMCKRCKHQIAEYEGVNVETGEMRVNEQFDGSCPKCRSSDLAYLDWYELEPKGLAA